MRLASRRQGRGCSRRSRPGRADAPRVARRLLAGGRRPVEHRRPPRRRARGAGVDDHRPRPGPRSRHRGRARRARRARGRRPQRIARRGAVGPLSRGPATRVRLPPAGGAPRRRGGIVGIGTTSRNIPRWLRRQVEHRDGYRCTFPACGARRFVEVHHVVPWPQGDTVITNLICACSFHHDLIHLHGWHAGLTDDGTVRWFRPDWTPYEPRPAPATGRRSLASIS